jgi:EmrB/QacA subfamily drug resistance transporter
MATSLTAPRGSERAAAGGGPSPVDASRKVRRAPRPTAVLAVASLGVFIAFVDATIVNIAFPDIERSFAGAGIAALSWVLNAYNIVFAAFLVAAGRIADLVGRRRVLLLGLVVFTAASLLCALAPSVGTLVAARIVQALGAALLVPSSLGLVLEAFPPERRSHAVALLTAVGAVAAGVGPSLGGLLVTASDWRLVFLVNVPVGVVAYVLARRTLVESRAPGRRRLPDLLGSALFALAVTALVLGVVKGPDWGWTAAETLASFVAALVLGAVVGQRSARHRSPVIDLGLLRIRTFTAANGMSIVAAAGFFGYTLANVLFLTGVWGYSVLEAGLAMTPGPFVAAAVAAPASNLAERYGHRAVLVPGGLVWGAAVLWLVTRVGPTPAFVAEWLPATVLLGIGAGITLPNLSGAAVASAPGESFATATALNSVARQVGAALGVALVVAILGEPTPLQAPAAFDDAWLFAAVCLAVAGLGCMLVGRVGVEDDVTRTPSLTHAARAVFAPAPAARPAAPVVAAAAPAPVVPAADGDGRPESVEQFLARVPLLAGLAAPLRAAVADRARPVELPAGAWLFRRGDPGDALYVVRAGRLEVVLDDEAHGDAGGDGRRATEGAVRVIGRGDAVGELALLTTSPRSASVRAARDSELIAIDRDEFQRLLHDGPELALALTRVLGEQLRASRPASLHVRPLAATIALVPLHDGLPARDLARRLADALREHGTVALLDGAELPAPDGGRSPAATYGALLDRAERGADRVLLVTGVPGGDGAWDRFCLQQADRVLAVAAGGPVPADVAGHRALQRCDLVAHGVVPGSGALAGWATALDPVESHVVRPGPELGEDVRRLARRLAGRSLGIVLSGGGARAFSHLGVLEELTAAGVRIDRVAGVSMGAFIGAMYAAGMDAGEMDAHLYDEWIRRRPLADYTLPRHALIRGHRVEAMLKRVYGSLAVEELPRAFFSGASELRSGELVLSRYGPVYEAVGLSLCLPIIAPPQVRGRDLLVDGALVDNLPVAAMAALGEGPIVAVDVKASFERDPAAPPRPAGGGGPARTPALGETLTRVLLLGSTNTSEAARRHADVVIEPRPDGVGLLEFHQLDRAREAGRAAARASSRTRPPRWVCDPMMQLRAGGLLWEGRRNHPALSPGGRKGPAMSSKRLALLPLLVTLATLAGAGPATAAESCVATDRVCLSVTSEPATASINGFASYVVALENKGPNTVNQVVLTDTPPDGRPVVSVTPTA